MFVKKSNLPENTKIVLLGEKYCDELKNPLENLGVNVLPVPDNPFVDPRLSSHADLSVFHAGDNHIFLAEYLKKSELYDNLRRLGFEVTVPEVKWGACYPDDCSFNLFFNGDYVICNKDTANESILRHLGSSPKLVFCKQGYCKCLICAVDDNAIITEDISISGALTVILVNI